MRKAAPLLAALVLCAAGAPPQGAFAAGGPTTVVAQAPAALSDADRAFMTEATQTGAADVRLSELAVNRAKSSRVQDFARTVVRERSAANDALAQLALAKGVQVAAEPTAEQQHVMDQLDELAGSEFDVEYMARQVSSYENAVILHRAQLEQTGDADLRGYIESSLAVLEEHLEAARQLAEQVRASAN
jgi:putative membrane protein